MQQSNHQEGENNNTRTVIDQLVIKFHPKTGTDKIEMIELYNRVETQNLSGEFQIALEWVQFLNNYLNNRVI
jgi:hypothetical protein